MGVFSVLASLKVTNYVIAIELMHEWATKYNWEVILLCKTGDETKDFITVELYEFRPFSPKDIPIATFTKK